MTQRAAPDFQGDDAVRAASTDTVSSQIVEFNSTASGDFLTVVRPPTRDPRVVRVAVILAAAGVIGIALLQWMLWLWSARGIIGGKEPAIRLMQAGDLILISCVLALYLASSWTLCLSPSNLEISHSVLGILLSRKSFKNEDVMDLRYARWQTQADNRTIENSGIKFEVGSKTYSFGRSVTESDGNELISRMRAMYNFPVSEEGSYMQQH